MMAALKSPFPNFSQLAPRAWLFIPSERQTYGSRSSTVRPDLVIMCTWMAAAPKHILKYTDAYRVLYPSSQLLLLTNSVRDMIISSEKGIKKSLDPAVSIVRNGALSNPKAVILLHIFSNGGANHACQLARLYRDTYTSPLPVTAVVLDSAPGRATYRRSVAAMSVGLPRSILFRLIGLVSLHILCIVTWICVNVFHLPNVITKMRDAINDPTLFSIQASRMYLYSKADAMVGWRDVESSAKAAAEKGWEAKLVRFQNSKHVGHMIEDNKMYWTAVERAVGEK